MQPTLSTKLEVASPSHRTDVDRGALRRSHRFIAAFFVLGIGATTHAQQELFDGDGGDGSLITDVLNWDSGVYPGDPGNDFGGTGIEFTFGVIPTNDFNILVDVDVINLGDFTITQDDVDIVFDLDGATGSFSFVNGALIDPGNGGSFTFNLDVTALEDMTFNLGSGDVIFNGTFTTSPDVANPGTITADGGILQFGSNSTVESGAGTIWTANNAGGFDFGGAFNATGNQTFTGLSATVADNDFDWNAATFTATAAGEFAIFDAVDARFSDLVTIDVDGNDNYGIRVTNAAQLQFEDLVSNATQLIFDVVDADAMLSITGDVEVAEGSSLLVQGDGMVEFAASSDTALPDAFTLLVDGGATVEWLGDISLGDAPGGDASFVIDTVGVGNATINFQGRMALGSEVTSARISVTTDGTDDVVSFYRDAIRGLDATIVAEDNSSFTLYDFNAAPAGAPTIAAELNTGSTLRLDVPDTPFANGDFILSSIEGGLAAGDDDLGDATVTITYDNTSTNERDVSLFIRGGRYGGTISQEDNTGDNNLTVGWTQEASTLVGVDLGAGNYQVDIGGRYEARNNGIHTVGIDGRDVARIRSGGLSVVQATMVIENGEFLLRDFNEDGRRGDVLVSSVGAEADGVLQLKNASTLVAEGALDLGLDSMFILEDDATASFDGIGTIAGSLMASDSTQITFNDTIDLAATGTWRLEDSAQATVAGAGTIAGMLMLTDSSRIDFDSTIDLGVDGVWMLEDDARATVAGAGSIAGLLSVGEGTQITFDEDLTVSNGGRVLVSGDSTGGAAATMEVRSLDLEDGSIFQLLGRADPDGAFNPASLTVTDGELRVRSGATLIADGTVSITDGGVGGELFVAGTLIAGDYDTDTGIVETSGKLDLTNGDLVVNNGTLRFGMSSSSINSTLIDVHSGIADFTGGATLGFDVKGVDYMPTDRFYTIVRAGGGILGGSDLTVDPAARSVTRWWDPPSEVGNTIQIASGSDYTLRNAEYQSQYTLDSDLLPTAEFLNQTLRPLANSDPTSAAANFLGTLDQYQSLAEYEANLLSTQPTAQASAVQMPIFSQYTTVLRNELQKKSALVEQRTRAPFRLSDPLDLVANQAEVAERNIRQRTRSATDSRGFGVFWGGEITTPTKGIVEGANGTEWGGLGGFAWDLGESVSAGVNVGYSAFTGNVNDGFGDMRVGTLRLGGFATWTHENFFMDVGLAGGWNHFDVTRNVFSQGAGLGSQTFNSTSDGFLVEGTVGLGYRIPLGESFALTPEGSFLYNYITTGDMDEGGSASAALKVDPGDVNAFTGRVGADLSWSALPGLVFDVAAGWQGTFIENGGYSSTLTNINVALPVTVDNETINTAYYGGGVNFDASWNVSVDFRYEGRQGDGLDQNMFFGGVSISF